MREINPLDAPGLYTRHFTGARGDVVTIAGRRFEKISALADDASGFRADVMLERASGHAVILYKGMDVPFSGVGMGRLDFLKDAFTAVQAKVSGGINRQTPFAEEIYRQTKDNPAVKSIETIGFSLGTLHANYIAAKYGVKATVISDLGIGGDMLREAFGAAAEDRLKKNVTALVMDCDVIPYLFGAGPHRGKVIGLDGEGWLPDLLGISHMSQVYERDAKRMAAAAPETGFF
jgi:hypothetical protein